VDRAIITLFVQKQVSKKFFEKDNVTKNLVLTKQGREKTISAVMGRLYKKTKFKGKKTTFQNIILMQARDITNQLLDKNKKFEAFIYKW